MSVSGRPFDYDRGGSDYSQHRRADPRIAERIRLALGNARTVLNVGAGTGSYEPQDRYVASVEPSRTMRAQRLALGRHPAINAGADSLPFDDASFDACLATLTIHHWPDIGHGLDELRRVARWRVVIASYDPDALDGYWNAEYFAEVVAVERARYPGLGFVAERLGGQCTIQSVPIPLDCTDGFQEAFYGRPEELLRPEIRRNQSAWGFVAPDVEARLVRKLELELKSGEWDRKHGHHRTMPVLDGALRLIVAEYGPTVDDSSILR